MNLYEFSSILRINKKKEKKKKSDPDYQLYFQKAQKLAHIED